MGEYESELSKIVDQLNRSAISGRSSEKRSLDQLLALAFRRNASDVILVAGSPVTLRVNGALASDGGAPLSAEDIRGILLRANIETGRAEGMMTMEQSLVELVRTGRISRETAFAHCYHPKDLERHLDV